MKILVDVRRCVGHARCAAIAPDVFVLNDEGYNVTRLIRVPKELEEQAAAGARSCPEGIIQIVDDDDEPRD